MKSETVIDAKAEHFVSTAVYVRTAPKQRTVIIEHARA